MNTVAIEIEVIENLESTGEETPTLSVEQLSMIAGGQCTTNSI